MQRIATAGADVTPLGEGWSLVLTAPDAAATPDGVDRTGAIPAIVPGTVAAALEVAGQFDRNRPRPLLDEDAWYFIDLAGPPGDAVLRFEGLATITEVFLNGEQIGASESMFEVHDLPVTLRGGDRLALVFRALGPHLAKSGPRARWRPRMMSSQGLRLVRTTLLGHMPGWCPDIHAVGPYRPVSLIRPAKTALSGVELRASLDEAGTGHLTLRLRSDADGPFRLCCHGRSAALVRGEDGVWSAGLDLPDVEPWFPHSHGRPALHAVGLATAEGEIDLGLTGFRRVTAGTGQDGKGFSLAINGVPVFARGAVWTNADIVRLPGGEADYLPLLEQARDAGMNMIRIGGTMTYESPAFFAACDRLGLMVWQDLMFANFDYPVRDEAFVSHVRRELDDQLSPISAAPSLTVLCGGSEIYQQAAMLGLPKAIAEGPLTEVILREAAAALRPDVPYVANSPFGGAMPFAPNEGVTHYYGVGAYERPLEDARRANVRFAAETLAFSQVPENRTLETQLPVPAVHHPLWKARVPRDRDASWDFEDTRDHYLGLLYGVDPARLRREDPGRYLDLSRAVTGEVSVAVFSEWRRHGSGCGGGLVWTLQDLMPGPGWGLIDATGEPKPVLHALKRVFRPVQVLLTDEGTNGLDIHLVNETADARALELAVSCLRDGQQAVVSGRRVLELAPRSTERLAATDLFGAFFDTTYAFRFGPPSHDAVVARLSDPASGETVSEAFHFPLGHSAALHAAQIETALERDDDGWTLVLTADRLAQSVHGDSDSHRLAESWFHLAPGVRRVVRLIPRAGTDAAALPSGTVSALGSRQSFAF